MANGQNRPDIDRFPRRDRPRCSIIKEPPDDYRIGNGLVSLLRRPCIGLVLAVVATRAFDCRAASVVGDNFPSNDEHRTCILHPILHQFTLVCHSISSRFIVLALHLGPDTQTIDEFFHLILFTIRFVKRKWHVQMHCPVYKQSCQK